MKASWNEWMTSAKQGVICRGIAKDERNRWIIWARYDIDLNSFRGLCFQWLIWWARQKSILWDKRMRKMKESGIKFGSDWGWMWTAHRKRRIWQKQKTRTWKIYFKMLDCITYKYLKRVFEIQWHWQCRGVMCQMKLSERVWYGMWGCVNCMRCICMEGNWGNGVYNDNDDDEKCQKKGKLNV